MFDFALNQFYLVWIAKPFNLHKVGYYNGDHILLVQYTSLGQTGVFCVLGFCWFLSVCLFLSLEGMLKTNIHILEVCNILKLCKNTCNKEYSIIKKYRYSCCMCHIALIISDDISNIISLFPQLLYLWPSMFYLLLIQNKQELNSSLTLFLQWVV